MCAIYGFYHRDPKGLQDTNQVMELQAILRRLHRRCTERGRDSAGIASFYDDAHVSTQRVTNSDGSSSLPIKLDVGVRAVLANCRAEPTNEWTPNIKPSDIQPYNNEHGMRWPSDIYAVHNGTIANDKQFMHAAAPTKIDSQAIPYAAEFGLSGLQKLIGSVAAAVYYNRGGEIEADHTMIIARNYRPVSVLFLPHFNGFLFASCREYMTEVLDVLPYIDVPLEANESLTLVPMCHPADHGSIQYDTTTFDKPRAYDDTAVVVLSGGLDSTTSAALACDRHEAVVLAHFHYGCRAQGKETEAVTAIFEHLKQQYPQTSITLKFFDLDFLKQLGGNPLTDDTMEVAQGEAGVEYANEWVPFRNGLMLSMIIAYCDRWNLKNIYLGANLEEAGAFGDNEHEFFQLMQKAAAIGSKVAPVIHNPLGNLMKHEIVEQARLCDAPVHLSWSCYHGGAQHCGQCGPCYLRQKAYAMNGYQDSVTYEKPMAIAV